MSVVLTGWNLLHRVSSREMSLSAGQSAGAADYSNQFGELPV